MLCRSTIRAALLIIFPTIKPHCSLYSLLQSRVACYLPYCKTDALLHPRVVRRSG